MYRPSRLFVGIVIGCVAAGGCGTKTTADRPVTANRSSSSEFAELERLAADLGSDQPSAKDAFNAWMSSHVKVGITTLYEVATLFPKEPRNLDRPARDNVTAVEFLIWDDGYSNSIFVVCEFDAKTQALAHWETSHSICGFCPHVLVDDGRWRLEGKMLAGCVGPQSKGTDHLVLPRLVERHDGLHVRLANWAQEMESIDQLELGVISLEGDQELDVDDSSIPFVWTILRSIDVSQNQSRTSSRLQIDCDPANGENLIVVEARNTSDFESAMRTHLLSNGDKPTGTLLTVEMDGSDTRSIAPVGTKFFRRVVLQMVSNCHRVMIDVSKPMWFVRRVWVGSGAMAHDVRWRQPMRIVRRENATGQILYNRTQAGIRLCPGDEIDVTFASTDSTTGSNRLGFVLRMDGFYEFLQDSYSGSQQ